MRDISQKGILLLVIKDPTMEVKEITKRAQVRTGIGCVLFAYL